MTENTMSLAESPTSGARSPHHLSEEQIRFFDDNGYLILRQWVTGDLLQRAQEAGHRWIERGLRLAGTEAAGSDADFVFAKRPHGQVLFRVNYLHDKQEPASLELLGSPHVLGVAESLNGPNFVPTYESMVFKMPGDGEAIPWHQDAVFPRKYRTWNFDLYLDASKADGGALRVIPATHTEQHDVCCIQEKYGYDHPDLLTVEMEPGDVLIHDDMVLHGSPQVEGKKLRRTIYFEFRSVEQIREEGPWGRDWIDQRLRLIPLAVKRYRQRYPDAPQFEWRVTPEYRPDISDDEDAELRVIHTVHTSGSYCSAGSARNLQPAG